MGPQQIRFYEKRGFQFLERFQTLNKSRKPMFVFMENKVNNVDTIKISDAVDNKLGSFDLMFSPDERTIYGHNFKVETEGEHVGEMLSLSSLMELAQNKFNFLKMYATKERLPFFSRYGFVIDNENPEYIFHALKQIEKTRAPESDDFQYSAKFYGPKVLNSEEYLHEDPFILQRGCKVISDFLAHLARRHLDRHIPELIDGSKIKFSDWEFETNRWRLNPMLKEHEIDYNF